MPDGTGYTEGSGRKIASREVTYSGELMHSQIVGLATFVGADDAKLMSDISEQNPLPIQEVGRPGSVNQRILQILTSPVGYDRSLGRQRSTAVIESGTVTVSSISAGTITTVSNITAGTITTVTGVTNIDGRNGSMLINATNLEAWRICHRALIT
jgi:hypothetical protein